MYHPEEAVEETELLVLELDEVLEVDDELVVAEVVEVVDKETASGFHPQGCRDKRSLATYKLMRLTPSYLLLLSPSQFMLQSEESAFAVSLAMTMPHQHSEPYSTPEKGSRCQRRWRGSRRIRRPSVLWRLWEASSPLTWV